MPSQIVATQHISTAKQETGKGALIKAKEFVLVGSLLIAVLIVFFSHSLFSSQVLSAADGVFATPFFAALAPADYAYPSNPLLFDQVYQFTPWRHFAWESLNQGRLPLWNPYSSTGTPFIATMQSAVFYPVNLLQQFAPFEYTMILSAFLRLWIAGICTYLLVRFYGLGMVAACISSISFMLSGFLIVWIGHPHTNAAILLPAIILLAEMLLQATYKSRMLFITAVLALTIGMQFTGGHIETSIDILLAFGVYYLLRWVILIYPRQSTLGAKLKRLVIFPGLAIILGTCIAAIQLMPFLEWLPLSSEFHRRGSLVSGFQVLDATFWRQLLELPVALFPNVYNNPTWNNYPYWSFLPSGNYNENVLYIGTLTLILAFIALFVGWKKEPLVKVWFLIGLLNFGRAFHLPIFDWLNQLPVLNLGHADRLRLILTFSLCVLAGFGAETLWKQSRLEGKAAQKLWLWGCNAVIGMGLLMMVAGNTILPAVQDRVIAYGREQTDLQLANRSTPQQYPIEHYYAQVDKMVDGLLAAFRFDNFAMYSPILWALAGLLILIGVRKKYPHKPIYFQVGLLSLVIIDLISFGKTYNPSVSPDDFYPRTPIIQQVAADSSLFRFTALRQELIPDTQMIFDLQDARGLDFPTHWYNQYLDLIPERIPWLSYGTIFSSVDSSLLKNLNIKYVVTSEPSLLANQDIETIAQEGGLYLGELVNATPRAYMVYEAVIAKDDDVAAEILRREPEAVFQRVILSDVENPPLSLPTAEHIEGDNKAATVSLVAYEASQSSWNIVTPEDGYLFVSDAYYPGWNAYLDHQPTELYRANIAFRAVYLPAGAHTMSFKYEPTSIYLGAIISGFSLFLTLVLLGFTLKSRSSHKQ